MRFAKILGLTLAGLFCLNLANGAAVNNGRFSAFNILQRMVGNDKLPSKVSSNEDYFPFLNSLVFQMTTGVLGLGKFTSALTEYNTFPIMLPLMWQFTKESCDEAGDCEEYHYQIQIGGYDDAEYTTVLEGALENYAKVNFGNDSFTYRYTVPYYQLRSSDFLSLESNYRTGYQLEYSGLVVTLSNTTIGMDLNFKFENGKYSVSNLNMTLEYGSTTLVVPKVSLKEQGADWRDLGSLEADFAPVVMELLQERDDQGRTLKERYGTYLEEKINQLLSGDN